MFSDRLSSELSGDGSVLALFPDNRRFQQFCLHLKEQEKSLKHWFLQVSWELAAGRDANSSPPRKSRVSDGTIHFVWQQPAVQETYVPHFLQKQPGNNKTAYAFLTVQTAQWRKKSVCIGLCCPWDMEEQPRGRSVSCEGRYMDVDVSCSWLILLLPGGNPKRPGREQGKVRRQNIFLFRKTSFINSSVSRTTCFIVALVFHRLCKAFVSPLAFAELFSSAECVSCWTCTRVRLPIYAWIDLLGCHCSSCWEHRCCILIF